jgi:hypothetical protein
MVIVMGGSCLAAASVRTQVPTAESAACAVWPTASQLPTTAAVTVLDKLVIGSSSLLHSDRIVLQAAALVMGVAVWIQPPFSPQCHELHRHRQSQIE